ncbi:MAG: hypothetical protein ACI8XB_002746 [Patiriisocius sp.]|jgi:hypothetical protein
MILYNVTVNLEESILADWLHWMKEVHIPEVMETGFFLDNKIWKVLTNGDSGFTYSIQYTLKSMADYNVYITSRAPALQQKHIARFGDNALAFRTLLELEHHHG